MAFPTTLDSDFGTLVDNVDAHAASQINEIRRAVEGLEAKVGIDSSLVTTSLDYLVNNFFESGRRMWLYEDAAPTGWTHMASVADRVIAVKGGSNAFNVVGGNQAGTWTQPNHTHSGPSHNHKWYDNQGYHNNDYSFDTNGNSISLPIASAYSGYRHMKIRIDDENYRIGSDLYTNNASGTTGNGATASTWRPYGAVGIIVEKD